MVVMNLNDDRIKAGEELLRQLDYSGVQVDAALWFYLAEVGNWTLMLSLPGLIARGPRTAYKRVQKALSALPEEIAISLSDVSVAESNTSLFRLLRKAIGTRPGINRLRFTNNVVNGRLIDDALIYRLT